MLVECLINKLNLNLKSKEFFIIDYFLVYPFRKFEKYSVFLSTTLPDAKLEWGKLLLINLSKYTTNFETASHLVVQVTKNRTAEITSKFCLKIFATIRNSSKKEDHSAVETVRMIVRVEMAGENRNTFLMCVCETVAVKEPFRCLQL